MALASVMRVPAERVRYSCLAAVQEQTRKDAPIVEAVYETNWSFTKRRPMQVLPTPDAPRMTTLASCFDAADAVKAAICLRSVYE